MPWETCYNAARMKMKNIVNTILVMSLLAGCSNTSASSENKTTTYANTSIAEVFDTVYSYTEYTASQTDAKARYEDSVEILTCCNQLFDIYNDYEGINNLKTINDNAGIAPVEVDPLIIDMLKRAKMFYDLSENEFDITQGSLLKVWHNYRTEGIELNTDGKYGPVPSIDELQTAHEKGGWENVVIDEEKSTVYITEEGASLDVGGIAKGYAAEYTAAKMMEKGMEAGFLNVGRNIRLVGDKPDGSPWRIGIADPSGTFTDGIVTVELPEPLSVVTSGDYERYYIGEDGNRYSHIIDPETLYPAALYRSVSILTPDSGDADCLSTALFTLSIEEGKALINAYQNETGHMVNVIWIMSEQQKQDTDTIQVGDLYASYTEGLEGKLTWAD